MSTLSKIPDIDAQERRPLTPKEVELITSTHQGHRMGIPAMLLLYCGLRKGELLALSWGDVNTKTKLLTVNKSVCFDGNSPYIKTPKTKAGTRTVPIPDMLIPLLQKHRSGTMMVCPDIKGDMMSEIAFKRAWQSYLHYLNISRRAAGSRRAQGQSCKS